MRASNPSTAGFLVYDGARLAYEVTGAGEPAVVFTPPDGPADDGRASWQAQVSYLARWHTVVTIGPVAAGSDPVAGTVAVMDACGAGQAVLAGHGTSGWTALRTAARHPGRVAGVAVVNPAAPAHVAQPAQAVRADIAALVGQVSCPVLVIGAPGGGIPPGGAGGAELLVLAGAGPRPQVTEPVVVNRELAAFAGRFRAPEPGTTRTWTRPLDRPRRVLFLSSLAGLGKAGRDLAIADELRKLRPGLQVHWLATHPVTELLRRRGEFIHPASACLAAETGQVESLAGEYELYLPGAVREMGSTMISNFMVFADLVRDEPYDLCIGDGAWELDHFLHENPELKRSAYAWLTDFAAWLPMPGSDDAERALTTRMNAAMIDQLARFPNVRDRALFVGNPGDVIGGTLGDGLPGIRDWVEEHYQFPGYIAGFRPSGVADRDAVRAELGYRPDEQVCVVTVGGSNVGAGLLRRAAAAFPAARRLIPGLRMVLVAGPRIDPASLGGPGGSGGPGSSGGPEIRGFVPDLYRHLAACDVAVTAGGLTTTMELTALRRPFLYVPLRRHFEQNLHVRHRLAQYQAGRCLDWEGTAPDGLAAAIAAELGREVSYRPVETDGAARAAASLAELL